MVRRLGLALLLAAALAALVPVVTALGQSAGEPEADAGSGFAKESEGEADGPLEQAREESGVEPPGPQRFRLPEGSLRVTPDALLAATPGQKLRFTVALDKAVAGATLTVRLPRRWVSVPASGLRATRAPAIARGKGRARVRRSDRTVALTLDQTDAGEGASFEIQDVGIPAGTYRLPFSWRDASGKRTGAGSAKVIFFARVREAPEGSRFTRLNNPGIPINATSDTIEESETFIATTEGDKDRILVGVNWQNADMAAWISSDAGHTWAQHTLPDTVDAPGTGTPETGVDICCDPMATADSLGNIWYGGLALDTNSPSRIIVNRVAAGTTTFQPQTVGLPVRTGGTQDKPMMTIDNTPTSPTYGRLYVVWDEPSNGGVNIVISQCDTRAGGFAQPQRCDNADNWTDPVTVVPDGSYIYADVAVGPDGRVYVTWWDYSNVNAIQGKVCTPGASTQNCASASGWGTPSTIALLDSTGGDPVPFACETLAQPGGRASTTPSVEVDHSGGANNGRVYVTWSDLRTGSGTQRCDGSPPPANLNFLNFDSFVTSAPSGALPGGALTSPNAGTRLITDAEAGNTADDWFSWLAIDQTTGQAWIDLYSTRLDATRETTQFYARSVTPTVTPAVLTLGTLTQVSTAASDYSTTNPCCNFDNDYGDYEGIAATEGVAYPVWTDNSSGGGDGEAFTFVSQVLAPPSAAKATTGDAGPLAGTTATVSGTVDPNGQATNWWVEYDTDGGPTYDNETTHLSAGSGRTVVPVAAGLTGLTPGTTYHYRVVANNGSDPQSNGVDRTFTTTTPAPTAITTPATSISTSAATLNASINPHGLPTSYQFKYGLAPNSTSFTAPASPASAGSGPVALPFAQPVSGLLPGTVYYFRIFATNTGGTAIGANQSFQTAGSAPRLPDVSTGAAGPIGVASATVAGTVNPRGRTTIRRFEYGLTAAYGSQTTAAGVGSGSSNVSTSALLQGLQANTTYHYRINATNAVGTRYGQDRTFLTGLLDLVGPKLKVSKRSLRMSSTGRVRVKVSCDKGEPEACAGTLRVYTVKRKASGKKVRVRLGSKKFKIAPGKSKRVRVKLSARGRRLVRAKGAVKLLGIARARDASGNLGKASRRFLVRAPL